VIAVLAGYHGTFSNGGWLRAQQGGPVVLWNRFRMEVTGIEEGNGFGGKWVGRQWNKLMESPRLHGGQQVYRYENGAGPGTGKRNVENPEAGGRLGRIADALHLTTGAEAAKNRRRVRMLVTGAVTPLAVFGLAAHRLINGDGDRKQGSGPGLVPGGPVPGTTPTAVPSTPAPSATATPQPSASASPSAHPPGGASTGPGQPTQPPVDGGKPRPPKQPPKDVYWTVDSRVDALSCFTCMAEEVSKRDHSDYGQALDQLFKLNPQYDRSKMDGRLTHDPSDPDALRDGTRIDTGVPAGAR
jgi:hypothetical protein